MAGKMRLHQYLSRTGKFTSKHDVFYAIESGQVTVDGERIVNPEYNLRPNRLVEVLGKPVEQVADTIYIAVNKPAGYLSSRLTRNDVRDCKKSVFSLVQVNGKELFFSLASAGRLDEDTCGLLMITNDGAYISRLTKPDSEIPKTYIAELRVPLKNEDRVILQKGVLIEVEDFGKRIKYRTKPCKIHMESKTTASITITEGKKREVRKIFAKTGNAVLKLTRVKIGNLRLSDLNIKEGKFKIVDKETALKALER
jgi:pseudouridine synthase